MCAKGIRFTKEEAVGKTDSGLVLTAEGSLQGVKEECGVLLEAGMSRGSLRKWREKSEEMLMKPGLAFKA